MAAKTGKREARRTVDYQRVFSGETGKRVLYDMMTRYHMLSPISGATVADIMFADGQRSVVLFILKELRTDAEQLYKELQIQEESEDL